MIQDEGANDIVTSTTNLSTTRDLMPSTDDSLSSLDSDDDFHSGC